MRLVLKNSIGTFPKFCNFQFRFTIKPYILNYQQFRLFCKNDVIKVSIFTLKTLYRQIFHIESKLFFKTVKEFFPRSVVLQFSLCFFIFDVFCLKKSHFCLKKFVFMFWLLHGSTFLHAVTFAYKRK